MSNRVRDLEWENDDMRMRIRRLEERIHRLESENQALRDELDEMRDAPAPWDDETGEYE